MTDIHSKLAKYEKYSYVLLVLYLPLYLIIFFAVELIIPESFDYWVSYCKIDDLISFNEHFIMLYWSWYPFLIITGLYLLFKDIPGFIRYMLFIAIGFTASEIIFLIFPNGQDLRPTVFANDNIFVDMVKMIYASDTNTNVLPSVHVMGSIAATLAICTTKTIKKRWIKYASVILTIGISHSTLAVKQHSILDAFAAIALSAIVYVVVYVVIKKKMDKKDKKYERITFKKAGTTKDH